MSTRPLTKTAIVGLPAGLLLTLADGGLGRTLAIVAGAGLIGLAWVRFERRAAALAARACDGHDRSGDERCTTPARDAPRERRIERRPAGRSPRDVRCPAPGATARSRRSR